MKILLSFYKTDWYFKLSDMKKIFWIYKDLWIPEIKYISFRVRWFKSKTYLYKDFNFTDKVLLEKIFFERWLKYISNADENWEKKNLNKIKDFDSEDDKYDLWYFDFWIRPDKHTKEQRVWYQWTWLSLKLDFNINNEQLFIKIFKILWNNYSPRQSSIWLLSEDKEKLWIKFNDIIKKEFRIFRWVFFIWYIPVELVNFIWKEKLLASPAYKVEILERGWVFIQSTQSLEDYINEDTRQQKIEELTTLNDYLISIMPSNEIQDKIAEKWNQELFDKHITINDLMDI